MSRELARVSSIERLRASMNFRELTNQRNLLMECLVFTTFFKNGVDKYVLTTPLLITPLKNTNAKQINLSRLTTDRRQVNCNVFDRLVWWRQ